MVFVAKRSDSSLETPGGRPPLPPLAKVAKRETRARVDMDLETRNLDGVESSGISFNSLNRGSAELVGRQLSVTPKSADLPRTRLPLSWCRLSAQPPPPRIRAGPYNPPRSCFVRFTRFSRAAVPAVPSRRRPGRGRGGLPARAQMASDPVQGVCAAPRRARPSPARGSGSGL